MYHVVALPVEDVDRAGCVVIGNHLQEHDALAGLNPAGGDRLAEFEEGLDGLLDRVGGAVAPVEQLVDGHLSQAAGHGNSPLFENWVGWVGWLARPDRQRQIPGSCQ
jgi:hypothetical protein